MFVLLFFLTLLYLPFRNGDPLPLPMSMDSDVYHTLFGNIGSMEDMFLKEDETTTPQPGRRHSAPLDDHDDSLDDLDFPDIHEFDRSKLTEHSFDIIDFLTINEQHANFTKEYKNKMKKNPKRNLRRNLNRNPMRNETMGNQTTSFKNRRANYFQDPDDYWHSEYIEPYKKKKLVMVLAQFALHCRYEVGKALTQRDLVRKDKRYKIGYLFNRLRRLKTEQLKQVGASELQREKKLDVYAMMRSYERVVHFDVDMRDTANLIKRIMAVDEPYDYFEGRQKPPPLSLNKMKSKRNPNETQKVGQNKTL